MFYLAISTPDSGAVGLPFRPVLAADLEFSSLCTCLHALVGLVALIVNLALLKMRPVNAKDKGGNDPV